MRVLRKIARIIVVLALVPADVAYAGTPLQQDGGAEKAAATSLPASSADVSSDVSAVSLNNPINVLPPPEKRGLNGPAAAKVLNPTE
ncbi:hypothetical protein ABH944_008426 [Caballeronia udeis]|uniref:Uncharacterized protein n=1 Tax=Caballeronia udeis TaxID=1232866 RepID=A0ABW8MXB2_9BURK